MASLEHRTSIAEVTGSNAVEALIFFRLLHSSCLNWKIHCEDHSSLSIVTKKELFRFGIKRDDKCLYCRDKDSVEHYFIECAFTKLFTQNVLVWFNQINECQISPTTEEILFGVTVS